MKRFTPAIRRIAYKYNIGVNEADVYVRKARQQAIGANLTPTDQTIMGLVAQLIRKDKDAKNRKPPNLLPT